MKRQGRTIEPTNCDSFDEYDEQYGHSSAVLIDHCDKEISALKDHINQWKDRLFAEGVVALT